jgi:hypothetical protein
MIRSPMGHFTAETEVAPVTLSPRYTTHRPRCGTCGKPLEPAMSTNDGEPCFRGFWPCWDHPHARTVYPPIPERP